MKNSMLALCFLVASCACFDKSSPEYNDPKCVAGRLVIDCTTAAVQGLMPAALAIIMPLLSGSTSIDWNFILDRLKGAGVSDGICILQSLQAGMTFKPQGIQSAAQGVALREVIDRLKRENGMSGAKVKVIVDGKPMLL
jgi:hypothetical protein